MDDVIAQYLLELEAMDEAQDTEPEPYTLNELIDIWQRMTVD